MTGSAGQAVRGAGWVLHRLVHGLLAVAILVCGLGLVAAWRLSQGPVDLSWLNRRIEAAVNDVDSPTRLTIGQTELTWEGFHRGIDHPIDLRLRDIVVSGPAGNLLELPRADMTLSMRALVSGRLLPRDIALEGARLTLARAADGTVSINLGALAETTEPGAGAGSAAFALNDVLDELARPAGGDTGGLRGVLTQLRRVRIRDSSAVVADRQVDAVWRAPRIEVDLIRGSHGGMQGTVNLTLALGDQQTQLDATASMAAGDGGVKVQARLAEVAPAALARAAPGLRVLEALDAPVAADVTLDLAHDLSVRGGRAAVRLGAGRVRVADGWMPVVRADATATGGPSEMTLEAAHLVLPGHGDGPPTTLSLNGSARRADGRMTAELALAVDQIGFADLPALWPAGLAVNVRDWLLENITEGMARGAAFRFELAGNADLSAVQVTAASGTLLGEDLVVSWLRPVPPLEQGQAELRLLDPDTMEIVVKSGRQRVSERSAPLPIRGGKVRITGLSVKDQFMDIDADAGGPVSSIVTLLRHPRLQLLDRHPIDLREPSGEASVALSVKLPLEKKLTMDDVAIRAVAKLNQVHLTGFVAGRNLDQGVFDMTVTNDQLTVKGRARLAGIDAQVEGAMDFRANAAVAQRVTVTGRPSMGQLAAAGIDLADTVFGEVPMTAVLTERPNGDGEVVVDADLTPAVLAVRPIGWRKPEAVAAKGTARIRYAHGKLTGIDQVTIDGDGVLVRGETVCTDGRVAGLRFTRAVLGKSDLHGSIALPVNGPIGVTLAGPALDIAGKLTEKPARQPKPRTEPPPGPAWTLDARLDRVLLAHDKVATGVTAKVAHDGLVTRALAVHGQAGDGAFSVTIDGARHLRVTAQDAGAFLRGTDMIRSIEGGHLKLEGDYDDSTPEHALNGNAEITDFRVRNAPALGKLLQAMTLYGLVDILRGPGIGFSRLVAPLRLDDDGLELKEARAFSPSLGLTAKGRIDLVEERTDIQGTIVPAYFFNSLLGKVPFVGRLFSPEEGGGLFAARYSIRGPNDDPAVFVNPLSALTPGFLREMFGIF